MIDPDRARKEKALEAAKACAAALKERFGAREVHIVGSLAGQGPWHSRSDIDLAVGGLPPEKYMQAYSALADMLPEGMDLDLISLENVPPEVASRFRGESKMPDDPKLALKVEIFDELAYLDRLLGHVRELLSNVSGEPGFIETNAAGKILHDFYCGIERAFERIAVRLGPSAARAIDDALASRFAGFLAFRDLFRQARCLDLEWTKLEPLLADVEPTFHAVRRALEDFVGGL